MTRQEIMSKAWTLARQGQERFGGKLRQYIASALQIVWKESKAVEIKDRIGELEAKGFKRWQKNGMDRLYLDYKQTGIEISFYKTGNVSFVSVDGGSVSNAEGRRIMASKTYIDVATGILHSNNYYMFNQACDLLGLQRSDDWHANTFEINVA